jgi:hypothetical protein
MISVRLALLVSTLSWVVAACSGSEPPLEDERDLTLPPAESVAVLGDEPASSEVAGESEGRAVQETGDRPRATQPRSEPTPSPAAETVPPARSTGILPQGMALELAAADTIGSAMSAAGDPVTATTTVEVRDERGRIVIPSGAVFTGNVAEIKHAGSPGGVGTLVLRFTELHFGGNTYPIAAESDSLGFEMKGQGISGGDAAKVGAGAVVGAVAGRVVGKNTKGAVIGGVVGAAAGAAVAAATKDQDIVLPAGGYIRIVLTQPLVLEQGG